MEKMGIMQCTREHIILQLVLLPVLLVVLLV